MLHTLGLVAALMLVMIVVIVPLASSTEHPWRGLFAIIVFALIAFYLTIGHAYAGQQPTSYRNPEKVRQFRKANPCPGTHKTSGACPGYVVDHKWPLCALGPDEPWNMQWQTKADSKKKDLIEDAACRKLKGAGK